MCGIVGMFNYAGKKINNTSCIADMLNRQTHRGPDDSGIRICDFANHWSKEICKEETLSYNGLDAVVGFNRLSIRDITCNGHQPMVKNNEKLKNDIIICFNGEIYNSENIKKELENRGYYFQGTSDTEVLLNCYIEYGLEKCLDLCDGMFAFAILDLNCNKLFLARDRVGIKPLYYINDGEKVYFASEYKSFLDLNDLNLTINFDAVTEFLIYRCIYQKTLFKEIDQVNPGEYLEFSYKGELQKYKYFNVDKYKREKSLNIDIENIINSSVKSQMVSDVNVGCQLSGGVDSSIVSYAAAQNGLGDTESIVFNEEKYNEKRYIDIVSKKINIKAHRYLFTEDDFRNYFEKSIYHLESILNHPNSMGIMKLTEKAKRNVSVLLSGEGGDELGGGYEWFSIGAKIRKGKNCDEKFSEFVIDFPQVIPTSLIKRCFHNADIGKIKDERRKLFDSFSGTLFDKQQKYEISTYLPEVLVRQDKMSMANSIENRVPLLSNEMIAYALRVPEKQLLAERFVPFHMQIEGKNVLKKLCAKYFGKEFAYRNKMGFPIPIVEYMKRDYFKKYFYENIYPDMKKRNWLDAEFVLEEYSRFCNGDGNFDLIWRCVCFEVWCQLFVDRRKYKII